MRHGHHRCGRWGHIEINIPKGLMAMRGRGGWRGGWGPFDLDDGDDEGSGRGRRGRRGPRMFGSGELRIVLLKLISEQPRHGYDLIRAVEELTGGEYAPSPGVIYPTLTLLQDMGLVEEAPGEGPRKPFKITDAGREYLESKAEEADELVERLKTFSPNHNPPGGSPVWRAVRNLGVAIRQQVRHGEIEGDRVHQIAAMIDELAQRIERLK